MKVYIKTYGCSLNRSDSEAMAGLLAKEGHQIVDTENEAQVVIFNTCTVKDSPEKQFYHALQKATEHGKKVVVAGCIAQTDADNPKLKGAQLVGVRDLSAIVEAVKDTDKPQRVVSLAHTQRLLLPTIRYNPIIEIIPISAGCLGACTFCLTKVARGHLHSYPIKDIKSQMMRALDEGVKEVWLTSQDCGAYGMDIGSGLIELLDELLSVKGHHMIRLGMANPEHVEPICTELAARLNHPRMFRFVHLPLQSASNKVLKDMNRKYTYEQFKRIVKCLRKKVGQLSVATDMIVGFPTETEEDFSQSLRAVEELEFDIINHSKFYPRPHTAAGRMKKLPTHLVAMRCKELGNLQSGIMINKEWIAWEGRVLIDEPGKRGTMMGRNGSYKAIVFKQPVSLGEWVDARVVKTHQFYLEAERV